MDAKPGSILPRCCIQETHLNIKERYYLWVKGCKNIFQENELKKQNDVVILIADKTDQTKTQRR